MLVDDVEHALIQAISAVEYLSFPVQDEFLQIECNGLGNAKVFGVLGDADLHFLADPEKMIDGMTTGKNDGSVLGDIDLLFAEIFGRHAHQRDKGMKSQFHIVFFGKLKIRRLFCFRPGLRD